MLEFGKTGRWGRKSFVWTEAGRQRRRAKILSERTWPSEKPELNCIFCAIVYFVYSGIGYWREEVERTNSGSDKGGQLKEAEEKQD